MIPEVATLSFNKEIFFKEVPVGFRVKSIDSPPVSVVQVDEAIRTSVDQNQHEAETFFRNEINTLRDEYAARQVEILTQINEKADETLNQLNINLPSLVMEIVGKILPGITLESDNIEQVVRSMLNEFSDKDEALEVYLCPDDLNLLKALGKSAPESGEDVLSESEEDGFASAIAGIFDNLDGEDALLPDLPKVKFFEDSSLSSGDCQVKSRFGLLDGRISTKIKKISEEISGHG